MDESLLLVGAHLISYSLSGLLSFPLHNIIHGKKDRGSNGSMYIEQVNDSPPLVAQVFLFGRFSIGSCSSSCCMEEGEDEEAMLTSRELHPLGAKPQNRTRTYDRG